MQPLRSIVTNYAPKFLPYGDFFDRQLWRGVTVGGTVGAACGVLDAYDFTFREFGARTNFDPNEIAGNVLIFSVVSPIFACHHAVVGAFVGGMGASVAFGLGPFVAAGAMVATPIYIYDQYRSRSIEKPE